MPASFSIGILCYGHYPELADKCLGTIFSGLDPRVVKDVRIGMNECSQLSDSVIRALTMDAPVPVYGFKVKTGISPAYKYPIMRNMLFHSTPVRSTHWMWFDDDTYVKPGANAFWMRDLAHHMQDYDVAGYRRFLRKIRSGQADGIRKQAWFNGKPVAEINTPFLQGGWWVMRTNLMSSWGYPFKELRHNNGDVMLGHLIKQRNWKELVLDEKTGPVAVDVHKRRGTADTPWPWQLGAPADFDHQNIRINVERLNPVKGETCPPNSETNSETLTSTPA